MGSAIYHFLNDQKIPERIQEAKKFERFARDLSQIEVRYAPLHLKANTDEQEIAHAVVELFELGDLLLRLEIEELHLNPKEQELVALCERMEGEGKERYISVPGLLRANEFILSPLAEAVPNPAKVAIASLLHETIFNGYFYSLIVNERKMKAMSESWQEVWRDFCFFRTLRFGEDTYWRANDPSDPILA